LIWYAQLTDIMQERAAPDIDQLGVVHPQTARQLQRQLRYALGMSRCFATDGLQFPPASWPGRSPCLSRRLLVQAQPI
jgi:hypothetical protein